MRRVFRTPEEFQQYVRHIHAGKPVVSRKELAIERIRSSQKNSLRNKGKVKQKAIEETLALAGAWKDLPADQLEEELDRIRHSSKPTPPLKL